MLSILRSQGVTKVLEDSSGNGGAAIAAYAAAGGLAAKILVPASTAQDKIVQMRAYGAEIELIPGTRQDVSDTAERQAATIFYAGHNWQPFFLQGTKTLAYELWEDLRFKAPTTSSSPLARAATSWVAISALGAFPLRRDPRKPAPTVRGPTGEFSAASRELRGRLR
jgi:threonine synthase